MNTGSNPKKRNVRTVHQLTELMSKRHLADDVDKLVGLLADLGVELAMDEPAQATA